MALSRLLCEAGLILLVIAACAWSKNAGVSDNKFPAMPLWKSLLVHHHRWSGYYAHDQTRFMCGMFVHSVDSSTKGTAHVSFTAEGFHIEMSAYSEDGHEVTFHEIHTWNKSAHFEGHTHLLFVGAFVEDYGYFKFVANVSSAEVHNYGSVTLIPQGRTLNDNSSSDKPKSKSLGLALAITIPLFLGIVVLTLAAFIVIWAVRKGYMRRVPWSYRTFRNPKTPKSEVEMDRATAASPSGGGEEGVKSPTETDVVKATVQGVEKTAVHI